MMREQIAPGTILANRYEVGELLGLGGFGATYRAVDRARFGAPCVVKELLASRSDSLTARRLFEREARLLSEISHPQIPKLHAYFEETNRFYLVQEYVDGQTLKQLLESRGRLSETETRRIVEQLLLVLSYLHERSAPLIHRDIKPANIILGSDGFVHLIDFGAVREVLGADGTQTAIGTPGYTPGEQAVGRPRPSSDLYALGATALEMISGQHPVEWYDQSAGELQWKGQVECSASFERFLEGSLAPLPARFPDAATARTALLEGEAPEPAIPVATATSSTSTTTPGSFRYWRLLVASVVAIGVTSPLLWVASSRRSSASSVSAAVSASAPDDRAAPMVRADSVAPAQASLTNADTARESPPTDSSTPSARSIPSTRAKPPIAPSSTKRERRDTTASGAADPDSLTAPCARLLERASLGETLSESEISQLRRRCR